jgi:SAM-dependent methyltransferase
VLEGLSSVPVAERDAWVDRVLGIDELADDGPALPRGCVPYLPCPVDVLLRVIDRAQVGPSDVFVDVGAGLGRAAAIVHLLTGAGVIGVEIQPQLVAAARALARRLQTPRVAFVEGDALELTRYLMVGTVFFFYCPFSGTRFEKVLADLEAIARTRPLRVCCAALPLPPCDWLALDPSSDEDLAIYRSS